MTLRLLLALACLLPSAVRAELSALPERAEDVTPVAVGSAAPDAELRTLEGAPVQLHSALGSGPTALIFYRGGW